MDIGKPVPIYKLLCFIHYTYLHIFVKCRSNMAVIITIIDAKELNLLINTNNKMINI